MANQRILILDDEPSVATLYASALEAAGHAVVVCTVFEEARDYVKQHTPDALLTDVRIGEYNGLQLAILFRSLCPDGALLVVSGHDDVVIRQEAARIRASFLLKPVDIGELRRFFAV